METRRTRTITGVPAASVLGLAIGLVPLAAQNRPPAVVWPNGARMALSLSFDDGRASQVETGTRLLKQLGASVTFFVVPSAMESRLEAWKQAVADGHEIGNHSLTHPCSGNFPWSRAKALEDYTLARMRKELIEANERIHALLGVTPRTFAYPCGQTFVGRGRHTESYVPLVADLFIAGRGWLDESSNDPAFADLAQLMGVEMDGRDFADMRPMIEEAKSRGGWLVLAGHDIGAPGPQTTRVTMLEELSAYVREPGQGVWLAPIGRVADHVNAQTRLARGR